MIQIAYVPPKKLIRIKNEAQFQQYYRGENLPANADILSQLDFSRVVYCICHRPVDKIAAKYIKCSLGKYGCNGWMHPSCVGLGDKTQSELNSMKYITCPFCTVYLEGSGDISAIKRKYPDVILLHAYTTPMSEDTVTNVLSEGNQLLSITASHNAPIHSSTIQVAPIAETQLSQQASGNLQSIHKGGGSQVKRPPSIPNMPAGIFQHRLLMDLMFPAVAATKGAVTIALSQKSKDDNNNNQSSKRKRSGKADETGVTSPQSSRLLPQRPKENEEEKAAAPEDEFEVDFSEEDPLMERVRKCRRENGKIENVRVLCGWLKKSNAASNEEQSGGEGQQLEEERRITEKIISKLQSTKSTRLVMRARQRMLERQRGVCIERSIAQACTGNATRRKPPIVNNQAAGWSIFPNEGRKPTLCYLPAEDGGLRLASVSHVLFLKSIHQWCSSRICGYCLSKVDQDSPSVSEIFGAVSYTIHLQCQLSLQRYNSANRRHESVYFKSPTQFSNMDCLGIYEYDRSEDAECDLCGLKGGVMQYFSIHSGCSMLTAPSREGWVAHIPCCFYLSKSNYLAPLVTNEDRSTTPELPSNAVAQRYYRKCMEDIARANAKVKVDNQLPMIISEESSSNECVIDMQVKDVDFRNDLEEASLPNLTRQPTVCEDHDSANGNRDLDRSDVENDDTASKQEDAVSTSTVKFEIERALNDILSQLCNDGNSSVHNSNEADIPELNSYAGGIAAGEEEVQEESSSQPHLPPSQDFPTSTTATATESPLSRFDLSFGKWRCSLCGLHSGLTIRCATVTCTVRCHPVCAHLSDVHSEGDSDEVAQADGKKSPKMKTKSKWLLCSAIKWNGLCNTGENLTIFCPVHSFGQGSEHNSAGEQIMA